MGSEIPKQADRKKLMEPFTRLQTPGVRTKDERGWGAPTGALSRVQAISTVAAALRYLCRCASYLSEAPQGRGWAMGGGFCLLIPPLPLVLQLNRPASFKRA